MNIHKFNIKPKDKQHKTIKWIIPDDIRQYVKKVNSSTWEIYSHEDILLKPKEVKFLMLGIGFMMSEGVVLTSLANSLSKKRCSIQNEVNLEDTVNIIAVITNNSKETVKIQENDLLFLVCYKKIMMVFKKMTEMKEKIYPELPTIREQPTAPNVVNGGSDDRGHSYRLKIIREVQNFLEEEIKKRDAFSKKYFRKAKVVNIVDNGLIVITIGAEGTGAVLLSTGVGVPFALALGISGVVTGAISLIGNIFSKKATTKVEKHLKIKTLAMAKLDTIASHVSKAMMDDFINDEEFMLIMEEMEKYKALKEEIRNNTKKKLKTEEEESLIERGRQEARESFRRLVEKNKTI